jgi:hypothetical protein
MARASKLITNQFHYNNWPASMYTLAWFLSSVTEHIQIIDSYSPNSTPQRYKGDPILNGIWTSSSDLAAVDCWFVFRCKTSIHTGLPAWECKIQWAGNYVYFYDVSGPYYGGEGNHRVCYARFAPRGGWNFADSAPDFAPTGLPNYVSGNNKPFVASDDNHLAITLDDGQLVSFRKEVSSYYNFSYFGTFIGDMNPVDITHQPMPRIQLASHSIDLNGNNGSIGDNCMIAEDSFLVSSSYGSLGFEDKDGNWQAVDFSLPSNAALLRQQSQPNMYPSQPELDMAPYQPMPSGYGLIGDIPALAIGQGVGGTLFDNKEWLSPASTYCVMMRWDGVTDI